jgi:hypothetical protein
MDINTDLGLHAKMGKWSIPQPEPYHYEELDSFLHVENRSISS